MPTSLDHRACWLVLGLLVLLPTCHSQNERAVRRFRLPYPHSSHLSDLSGSFMTPGPNASIVDGKYYRALTLIDGRLFVGGRDQLFSLNPADLSMIDPGIRVPCENCDNYVRVIQRLTNDTLLECETNYKNPFCEERSTKTLSEIKSDKVYLGTSESVAPFLHDQNATDWLLMDGLDIYVGTDLSLVAGALSRPAISKVELMLNSSQAVVGINVDLSTKQDTKVVIDFDQPQPQFVGDPVSYNGRLYFFYRELAAEFVEGKAVYSRVAVVCKNDKGGQAFLTYGSTDIVTFVKARLECSEGTKFPYHYDRIQDIYYSKSTGVVFAVFGTQPLEVASSAVCAYRLDEIEALFLNTSKFRAQFSDGELWREVDPDPVTPRPAQCPNTASYTDAQYSAILARAQLMFDTAANKLHYESPGGARSNPLLMIDGERFTQIVVDENVINDTDVMFIGTENGTVLKAYLSEDRSEAKVVEEISLNTRGLSHARVLTMLKSDADQAVFVGTDQGVYKVPFQHCRDYNTTCQNCVRDPYCSWENGVCLHLRKGLQDVCPPPPCNDDKIIIHNCPSRQVSYVRRLNVPNHPLNLFVMAEAAKEDNVSIMGNEIRCPPCASLPYTESRSVSSGREFLVLHINGSSTERESCLCSVVLKVECGATKAINFTITVDDSPQLNLNQECLDKLSNYDRDILQYKFGLNSWIRKQANSCGVEDLQTCKRHP